MGWFIFGFVFAIAIESFIRVLSGYQPSAKREAKRVTVSMPWWAWGLAGAAVYTAARKKKKGV